MSYYISRRVDLPFDLAVESVIAELAEQGFGVLTDIDISRTLEEKLGAKLRPYRILGACNPPFAYRALEAEDKIGTLLPCNVVVQQLNGDVEIAAVDPVASMQAVDNPALGEIAGVIREKLRAAVEAV
jgi:uncharacterized protein (DUF302 family)